MKINNFYLFVSLVFFCSCSSQKRLNTDFQLFQKGMDSIAKTQLIEPLIKENDVLNITVASESLNQSQTDIFNQGNKGGGMGNAKSDMDGYLVDRNGNLKLPYIGTIKAAGKKVLELEQDLTKKIAIYITNPIVNVKFARFKISILGEVRMPAAYNFPNQNINILNLISEAGGLTDFGKRSNVLVIREENNERKTYRIDLRDGNMFNSPAFQLQQNDIVYVNSNDNKLKITKTNPNFYQDLTLYLNVITSVALIANFILNATR
jgi:polysaccharide export outer membrane protein